MHGVRICVSGETCGEFVRTMSEPKIDDTSRQEHEDRSMFSKFKKRFEIVMGKLKSDNCVKGNRIGELK